MVSARGLAIPILGLAVLSPNLIWNAAHGFPTFSHMEANANWGHARYSVISAVEFVLGQFGVFGPIMMAGFVVAVWRLQRRAERDDGKVVLAAFSLPILALVIIQSFISDANANWAAVVYVGAIPLAVSRLLQWLSGRALWISLGLAGAAMVALWGVALKPSLASAVGQSNAFKRMQGWRQLGAAVAMEAEDGRYDTVAAGNRSILAELLFYARPRSAPIRAWDRNAAPHDHFQMAIPLRPASHRVLVVIAPAEAPVVTRTFDSFRLIRTVRIPIGGNSARVTQFYDAQGYKGPQHWP